MGIAATLAVFFIVLSIFSNCFGLRLDLSGALFSMLFCMAVGSPFVFTFRHLTISIRSQMKGKLGFFTSLACTIAFILFFNLLCSNMSSDMPEAIPAERLIEIIDVMIAGGFLMGLVHRMKNS